MDPKAPDTPKFNPVQFWGPVVAAESDKKAQMDTASVAETTATALDHEAVVDNASTRVVESAVLHKIGSKATVHLCESPCTGLSTKVTQKVLNSAA